VLSEHDVPIAPSTYYAHQAAHVTQAAWDDAQMANVALCVWRANRSLYGADKLATAMRKVGHDVGRDQAARLMGIVGIEGARRGKHTTTTTRRDPAAARHPDLIRRRWRMPTRPDQWCVADFTYVWTLEGFVYTSFVSDVCSRRILGWRVSSSKATPLVMAALEQALFIRRRGDARFTAQGLVFHSDARAIHRSDLHRSAPRRRDRPLHRHRRRRPGQRAHRINNRPVQDRADRARPPPELDRPSRGRTRDRQLGPLVQHDQDPPLHRKALADRVRRALPSDRQPPDRGGCVTRASIKPRAVQKARSTPLTRQLVTVLKVWLTEVPDRPHAPLFAGPRGEPLSRDAIRRLVTRHVLAAQRDCPALTTKRVTPHMLRHTCAMNLLQAGVDLATIALWLGHEGVETTQIYLHADLALKEEDTLARIGPQQGRGGTGRYRAPDSLIAFLTGL
jgi:transposase InsO family protein